MSYITNSENRKGVSSVVSTLLIVLVGIIIVGSIAFIIIRSTVTLSPTASCSSLSINPPISLQNICISSLKDELSLTLKRTIEDTDITILNFELHDGERRAEWLCSSFCGDCDILEPGSSKTYFLNTALYSPEIAVIQIRVDGCILESVPLKALETCST